MSIEIVKENYNPTVIKVMGIGGGGCNALDRMIHGGMTHIEFIAANTDLQSLSRSAAARKLQLGVQTTRGLGAGADPKVGQAAAEEQLEEIEAMLKGTDVLFLTTGMGGGTGTGATPTIAEAARKAGCLTVAVVTKPFHFEMGMRMQYALNGIEELKKHVDTLIVIPNQNLLNLRNKNLSINEAFKEADSVLMEGVRGISNLILKSGFVNVDFADIRTVMSKRGNAMLSVLEIDDAMPPEEIAENMLSNPLLERSDIRQAQAILLNISYGQNVLLQKIDKIIKAVTNKIDPQAVCIHGFIANPDYDKELKLTMIATGLSSPDASTLPDASAEKESAPNTENTTNRSTEIERDERAAVAKEAATPRAPRTESPAENGFFPQDVFTFAADKLGQNATATRRPASSEGLYREQETHQNSATHRPAGAMDLQKLPHEERESFAKDDLEIPAFLRAGKKLDL